jgi:hypothetical protein
MNMPGFTAETSIAPGQDWERYRNENEALETTRLASRVEPAGILLAAGCALALRHPACYWLLFI